jgi:uncharacterized protein YecE (DUF72 family)
VSVVIGTAGWSIPSPSASKFEAFGTSLQRYARVLNGVEINSSFHRSHRPSTWLRWGNSVPDSFRFSVKVPKAVTHEAKLQNVELLISKFISEIEPLGPKLAVLLVQLPPKLVFDPRSAQRFFDQLRGSSHARVVCEPRHRSWLEPEAERLLANNEVARVAADPSISLSAAIPGGWPGFAYWRLHGSPIVYKSSYSDEALEGYAQSVSDAISCGNDAWCIFDNTAASGALANALSLSERFDR